MGKRCQSWRKIGCLGIFSLRSTTKSVVPPVKNQREMEFLNLKKDEELEVQYEVEFTKLSRYVLHLVSDENRMFELGCKTKYLAQGCPM